MIYIKRELFKKVWRDFYGKNFDELNGNQVLQSGF